MLSPTFRSSDLFLASSRLLLHNVELQRSIQTNGDSGVMVLGQVDDAVLLYAQPSTPSGPQGAESKHACDKADLTLRSVWLACWTVSSSSKDHGSRKLD